MNEQVFEIKDDGEDECNIVGSEKNYSKILFQELLTEKVRDRSLEVARQRTTLKIALGNLLVCGYRIFKRMKSEECLILFKKSGFETRYAYFKILPKYSDTLDLKFFNGITFCIKEINRMKRSESHNFTIFVCYTDERSCLQITNGGVFFELVNPKSLPQNHKELLGLLGEENFTIKNFYEDEIDKNRELQHDSSEQFTKLKDILYHYIDTFGQKYKTNYYADLEKKCMTSFRISYLINTLNHMIFEQTKEPCKEGEQPLAYSHIESSSWTIFHNKKKILKGDRKDIVMTGSGRIKIIDVVFLCSLNKYINQNYQNEVELILSEYKNSYVNGKVKVMRIENEIDNERGNGLIYIYQMKQVSDFSMLLE